MKKIVLILFLIYHFNLVFGQTKSFPQMNCITTNDKKIALPDSTLNKPSVYVLLFSKKAEGALTTWMMPLYQDFAQDEVGDNTPKLFEEESYEANLQIVFVLNGTKQLAEGELKKHLNDNMDQMFLDHMLIYTGSFGANKKSLNITNEDEPYFFVVDTKGQILYQTYGALSEDKLLNIEQAVTGE
jgi:hypothetical protein